MPKKKPDSTPLEASEVVGLYEWGLGQGQEQQLRRYITEARSLTTLTHAVSIPEQYRSITQEVRTPFARDTWLRVTASLTRDDPVTHVEPRDDTQMGRTAANIGERWTRAAFDQMDKTIGENVVYTDTRSLVRDSESVIKVVHRPDAWATFPRRSKDEPAESYNERVDRYTKAAPLPFAWRVVDRLSMLFGDGEFGDEWALEYGEYPLPYLKSRYGMEQKGNRLVRPDDVLGGPPSAEGYFSSTAGMATKIEYWTADWWCVVVDGSYAPGFPRPNPYGPRLPYFRAKADPVLFQLLYLVPSLDALLTMWMNWAYLGAYPNPVIKTVPNTMAPQLDLPGGDEGQPNSGEDTGVRWKPGMQIELPPGQELSFLQAPPIGQDLKEMVAIFRTLIDVAGVPSVFRGIGGADQAGYAINQLIAAATLTYKRLGDALQKQLADAGEFLWWMVAHRIKQPVYVLDQLGTEDGSKWLGLKPSGQPSKGVAPVDLLGPMVVRFRPVLPTDEQARAMIAQQLVNAPKPLDSQRHAIEKYLQEEDPDRILDEIAVEKALDSPELTGRIMDAAQREAGLLPKLPPTAPALLGPTGQPLPSKPPGQAGAGMPSIQGIDMPLARTAVPMPPNPGPSLAGGVGVGGRPPGAFPGQP